MDTPETEKPGPLKLAELTDAVAAPTFVSVTDLFELDPTVTDPKFTGDGLALSCAVPAAMPVPVSEIETSRPVVSVVTASEPVTTPAALGLNLTVSLTL